MWLESVRLMQQNDRKGFVMAAKLAIPLPDYERIFRVIYSVLAHKSNVEVKSVEGSCVMFAQIGAEILKKHYGLNAVPKAGVAAYVLGIKDGVKIINVYGRFDAEHRIIATEDNFHCWIEVDGVAIDFMAPIFAESVGSYGHEINVPRQMFQKRTSEMANSPEEMENTPYRSGEFFLRRDDAIEAKIFKMAEQVPICSDFANACVSWFRRPPKSLMDVGMQDNKGGVYHLELIAPRVSGVW